MSRINKAPAAPFLPASTIGLALSVVCAAATPALAHIDVDGGGTHKTRTAGSSLKEAPCGAPGSARGNNIYTYRPGSTIEVGLIENISHPGYFRISFDADGDDDFAIPSGTSGEFGDCGGNANCGPGKEDYCSNETVLLDKLDMHPANANILAGEKYTWSVTLPNIECDNCTLQIIQMMNDFVVVADAHSAGTYPANDIYYHCIDLVLTNDPNVQTDEVLATPYENNGMACPRSDAPAPDPGTDDMSGMGGDDMSGTGGDDTPGDPAMVPGQTPAPAPMPTPGMNTTPGVGNTPASMGNAGMPAPAGTGGPGTPPGMGSAGAPGATTPPAGVGQVTGGVGTMAGSTPPSTTASSADDGGCSVASGSTRGVWGPIVLALLVLGFPRRRR